MPFDQISERADEGVDVARTGDPGCERDVVDRPRTVDAVLEPLAQLRCRHLARAGVLDGEQRGPVARCPGVDARGDLGDRAQLEYLTHPDVGVAPRPDRRDQLRGQQRVSAEFEEGVIGTDLLDTEQVGEQLGDLPLGVGGQVTECGAGLDVRIGQRAAVDLAVRGDRDFIEHDVAGRHHVFGQCCRHPRLDPLHVNRFQITTLGRGQVADEALAQPGEIARDDDGLADAGVHRDGGGDLTEFDAETADLDLFVGATDELDVAVRVQPGEVAGAVEPAAHGERVGDEALGGQAGTLVVPVRDMCSADVDLTDDADRHGPQRVVEQVHLRVDLRLADRHDARALLALDAVPAGVDDRLCRSVEVVQQGIERGVELVGHLTRQGFATDRYPLEAAPFVDARQGQEQPQQRGHEVHGGDALGAQQLGQVPDVVEAARARNDQARTACQHAEDLGDGHVEARRGHLQQPLVGVDLVFVDEPREVLGDRTVRHRDALGQTRRPRGVDEVGGVGRRQRPDPIGIGRIVVPQTVEVGDRLADHEFRVTVAQDERQPVLGVGRVDRQVHAAGLDDRQRGDHQFGRLLQQDRDAVLGTDALADQPVRQSVRLGVEFAVGVVPALVRDGDRIRGALGLRFDQRGQRGVRGAELLAGGHPAQPVGVGVVHQRELGQGPARIGQRGFQQHHVVPQHLVGQCGVEDFGQVLRLDQRPVVVEFHHEAQRQLGLMPAVLGPAAGDPRWAETPAVGLARTERDPGQSLDTVAAVRVELTHHAVQVDLLMGERPVGRVPGMSDEFPETPARFGAQAQRHGVAVVPQRVLGAAAAVEDRGGDQNVVGVGVAVQHGTEGREQHGVRRGAGLAGQLADPGHGIGVDAPGDALRAVAGRHEGAVRTRKFQRLRRIGEHRAPVLQCLGVVFGGHRCRNHLRQLLTFVGPREIAEEHLPGRVVPGDVVRGEQHDVLVGAGANQTDPQGRFGVELERRAELPLRQHLEPQAARRLRQVAEVVRAPARRQLVVDRQTGLARHIRPVGRA
ncbi:Uncharacterised protein [Mycobacteroides abscessus subsp. abscessus]|nr:Uncharacterised protein [Mycobacteroides abscessus subsp. abscessus]